MTRYDFVEALQYLKMRNDKEGNGFAQTPEEMLRQYLAEQAKKK